MQFLTYSGNNLIHADLPDSATVYYPPPARPGIAKRDIPAAVRRAFENPLGMPPLRELVSKDSKVLVAFDDNCQPFPPMRLPDIREICLETLLAMLASYGVQKKNIDLVCAVAIHRKMKPEELREMVGIVDRVGRVRIGHELDIGTDCSANRTGVCDVLPRLDLDLDLGIARGERGERALDEALGRRLYPQRDTRGHEASCAAKKHRQGQAAHDGLEAPAAHLERGLGHVVAADVLAEQIMHHRGVVDRTIE